MAIGVADYTDEDLPPDHRRALFLAIDLFVDECFDDVAALLDDGAFARTGMADYLPPKHLPRYTPQFAKQFLTCVLTVPWKLRAPGIHRLACTAEELALAAIIDRASDVLHDEGTDANYSNLVNVAFEDLDYEMLFEPEQDGIEDTAVGRMLAMAHLHFADWFTPFRPRVPVHPYVAPE